MKHFKFTLLLMLLMLPLALASTTEIQLKTNEEYAAKYAIRNINEDVLTGCTPYFVQDFKDTDWAAAYPVSFNLQPGQLQEINVVLTKPPVGYYLDVLQIKCDRTVNGTTYRDVDIISPNNEPVYSVTVQIAGEGEAYKVQPSDTFSFITKPGTEESAKFTIINTGTVDLPVKIPVNLTGVTFTPNNTVIGIGNRQEFIIKILTPSGFKSMNEKIIMQVGAYDEPFYLKGQLESEAAGTAALQSVIGGDVDVNGINIPGWFIAGIIIIAIYLLIQSEKKGGRK
jgi:hypothetical protein